MGGFRFFVLILWVWSAQAIAATVPEDHWLYPVDREWLFIADIEPMLSPYGVQRAIERCGTEKETPLDEQLCLHVPLFRAGTFPLADFPFGSLDKRVIFFGEQHPAQDIKTYLTENMARLREIGVNTLAFEMFLSDDQPVLDAYHANKVGIEAVKKALEAKWGYPSAGYLQMIEAAHALGFKILALDDRESFWGLEWWDEIHARDAHMGAILAKHLHRDPKMKVAALTGRLHAYAGFSKSEARRTLPEILHKEYGYDSHSVLAFAGQERGTLNAFHDVISGPISAYTKLPADHPYAEYLLFLR